MAFDLDLRLRPTTITDLVKHPVDQHTELCRVYQLIRRPPPAEVNAADNL